MKKVTKPFIIQRAKNTNEVRELFRKHNYNFPISDDLNILSQPVVLGNKVIPNRLGIQPLEGFDGTYDGKPEDLVFRRYERYGKGGAGLIWFEAVAVMDDGKCNPRQMTIKDENVKDFKLLVDRTIQAAKDSLGSDFKPYTVVQLTHSGRYSRDSNWNKVEYAAVFNPFLDIGNTNKIIYVSDEYIEKVEDEFVRAAENAAEAGFDAVDIKICHHYLLRELLSAVTREGKYGGSFENRTRALFNIIDKIKKKVGSAIDICVRMNAYDANRYPYGWGMSRDGDMKPDLEEPIKLVRMLVERGVRLINISTMLPRYKPFDKGEAAAYDDVTPINPYEGVEALLNATREIKQQVPESVIVGTGLSWFSSYGANVGAGCIQNGWFDIAGFGRQAFAYPSFPMDILKYGAMQTSKCCVMCDKCYDLIQNRSKGGCVVRDSEIYLPLYKELKLEN